MYVWSKLSSEKWADAWEQRFEIAGDERTVISKSPDRKTLRVDVYCDRKAEAQGIQNQYGGVVRRLKPQNWAALSHEPPPPVNVRGRLLICGLADKKMLAAVKAANGHRTVINIPPEMAFGSGHHATTATVLRWLVDYSQSRDGKPWTMLDLGAGSGLLAIAAAKLGASEIWGCDHDAKAVEVARRNVHLNGAAGVTIEEQDVLQWAPKRRWDCVTANIFADVLEAVIPKLAKAVKRNGVVILSGILKSQAGPCLEVGKRAGFVFDPILAKGKWVTALGRLHPRRQIRQGQT